VVIPSYTGAVKTAISIPDETFQEAERRADALGVSRSEFFTIAARHYIDELDAQSLTKRIDTVVDLLGEDDSSLAAVDHARAMLAPDTDEW
jgi:metal-responsive CopG/Arc/MetJ family transcriptional regulator